MSSFVQSSGSGSDVFFACCDVSQGSDTLTTYDEVKNAYDDGKVIIAYRFDQGYYGGGYQYYNLLSCDSVTFFFGSVIGPYLYDNKVYFEWYTISEYETYWMSGYFKLLG